MQPIVVHLRITPEVIRNTQLSLIFDENEKANRALEAHRGVRNGLDSVGEFYEAVTKAQEGQTTRVDLRIDCLPDVVVVQTVLRRV